MADDNHSIDQPAPSPTPKWPETPEGLLDELPPGPGIAQWPIELRPITRPGGGDASQRGIHGRRTGPADGPYYRERPVGYRRPFADGAKTRRQQVLSL